MYRYNSDKGIFLVFLDISINSMYFYDVCKFCNLQNM